jgi:MtrB/PioB family decaheme-associated outer membrane protein
MNVRSALSISTCAVALLIGVGPTVPEALAADMWTKGAPPLEGWWFHGEAEVGGRFFLNNPDRNGNIATGRDKSLAKFYEYKDESRGPFGNLFLQAGSNNGLYGLDFQAKNIGYLDQSYSLDLSKAGQQYLSLGWDQTPHVYSTSARSIFNGVGSNALTLAPGVATTLTADNVLATAAARAAALTTDINRLAHQTDIGIRRDTASVDYRYTPSDNWDIKLNYSNMHRLGTQVDSVPLGTGSSTALVQVPKPVDDVTQNFGVNGEYIGTSPWDKKFNFKVAYNGSVYQEANNSYTVENPFCSGPCVAPVAVENTFSRMSLWPSNQMNALSGTAGVDLPWMSRYVGTLSYTMMRQDDAFLPFSANSSSPVVALPAASLNGKVNTLLSNNVLTTQITPELKSKLSYRYYDYDNQTPRLGFPSGIVVNDTTSTNFANNNALPVSYTKQNFGAELDWRPNKQWNFGVAYDHERYDWTYEAVDTTRENSGKVFADWSPVNWAMLRASYLVGARRDGTYNESLYVGQYTPSWVPNAAYREFYLANRDRQVGKLSMPVTIMRGLTVTPNGGFRYDNYPVSDGLTIQQGLRFDRSWNAGVEVAYVLNPTTTFFTSYLREEYKKQIIQNATTGITDIDDRVDTVTFGVNYEAIPDKLDLTLKMVASWDTNTYYSPFIAAGGFPDVKTTFNRLDAMAKYKFDPATVRMLGWKGDVFAKLRYAWERNSVANWQNDLMDVYMFSRDPSAINQIYMAYNNPNYNVHLLAASLIYKW